MDTTPIPTMFQPINPRVFWPMARPALPYRPHITRQTREEWLALATQTLRPLFADRGYTIPAAVRCSVGFPKGHGRMDRVIGQCWDSRVSADGTFEIFISPTMDDVTKVLATHVHELCHAVVGHAAGHRKPFSDCARAVHLKGPWTATSPDDDFAAKILAPVLAAIPFPYPHRRMSVDGHGFFIPGPGTPPINPEDDPPGRIGKQTTRMHKRACPECSYTVRLSAKCIAMGEPLCGNSACSNFKQPMEV